MKNNPPRLRAKDIATTATYNFLPKSDDFPNETIGDFEECIAWDIKITGAGAANATVKYRTGADSTALVTLPPNGANWSFPGIANLSAVREFEIKAVSGAIVVDIKGLRE
jgi:hypothetical protein